VSFVGNETTVFHSYIKGVNNMPALHDPTHDPDRYSSGATLPYLHSQELEPDNDLQREKIVSHLMRGVELQRLPEALALRDQVFGGETISAADRDSLAQMVHIVDMAAALLDDEDLERAQRAVTRLQDEILDRARANE
jgi:hypothetical protein